MIFLLDEKDVEMIQSLNMDETVANEVHVFVKDMTKPSFTGNAVQTLLSRNAETKIQFVAISGKEELAFYVGSCVARGEHCTLVHLNVPVPAIYKEKVKIIEEKQRKKATPKKRVAKKSEVEAVVEKSTEVPAMNPPEPVLENV